MSQNGSTAALIAKTAAAAEPRQRQRQRQQKSGVGRGRARESGERVGGTRRAPELGLYLCAKDFDFSFFSSSSLCVSALLADL